MNILIIAINTIYSILHGTLSGILSFLFFYSLGAFFLSKKQLISGKFPIFPAFLGATFFSVLCWYAVQKGIPLQIFFQWLLLFYMVIFCMSLVLRNSCSDLFKNLILKKEIILFWFFAYIILYSLIYIFLPEPDSRYYLPITHINNLDIFSYINVTQDLLLGHTNIAHMSYLDTGGVYYQTPAAYYFHAWIAFFYNNNALNAAMPTLYTIASLIGLMIMYYCHRFFHCSRWVSLGIAAIVLSGSFYRYIMGFYFLSSLMGTVVWLAFLFEILQWDFSIAIKKQNWFKIFTMMMTYQCLLLLLYPIFFVFNLVISCTIRTLRCWFRFFLRRKFKCEVYSHAPFLWRKGLVNFVSFLACLLLIILILIGLFPDYVEMTIHHMTEYAHRVTTIFWGLPLLSPLAMLGLPSPLFLSVQSQMPAFAAFIMILMGLLYCTQFKKQSAACVLFLMAISVFFVYWIYYYIEGPTRYQPWKFASYFILPLVGVFWAVLFKALMPLAAYRKIVVMVISFCIVGNFCLFRFPLQPALKKEYHGLNVLNSIPERDLYVKMSNYRTTFLAVFYIRDKQLHFIGNAYPRYPTESVADISGNHSLFLESSQGCDAKESSGKKTKIHDLGCLYKK